MKPFLPGPQHAKSKTKQRDSTAIPRYAPKTRLNPRSPIPVSSPRSYPNDFDSQAETEYNRTDVEDYRVESELEYNMSGGRRADRPTKMQDFNRGPDQNRGSRPELRTSPQRHNDDPHFSSYGPDEMTQHFQETSLRDSPPFPVDGPSLYEQIHVLRLQNASVTYDPSSRSAYVHDPHGRNTSPLSSLRGFGPDFDPEKPNHDEIKAIDHALAHVINTGGRVQFLPFDCRPHLDANPLLVCNGCSRSFHTVRDRDNHMGAGKLPCPKCNAFFECPVQMEEHLSMVHRHHRGSTHPGTPSTGYSEPFNPRNENQGGWNKGASR
ncbi:hypothetical protein B0A52_02709 [Exophiala mesophila]|uniref:C2H2-type domain-containing protein n=1 Tax=Exophiala mesophila TaxID=212818 RepID=A0A438NDU6_EXOME|nr:hypothetical protein B0A52_02709 [Exophiala mesophila]